MNMLLVLKLMLYIPVNNFSVGKFSLLDPLLLSSKYKFALYIEGLAGFHRSVKRKDRKLGLNITVIFPAWGCTKKLD